MSSKQYCTKKKQNRQEKTVFGLCFFCFLDCRRGGGEGQMAWRENDGCDSAGILIYFFYPLRQIYWKRKKNERKRSRAAGGTEKKERTGQRMSVFRQKNIDKVSSPEQLNDYIRVTTPSVWLVLAALVLLLIGMLVWSVLGTVEATDVNGVTKEIHPITLVTN